MSHTQNNIFTEQWLERREAWLENEGVKEKDVMDGEELGEYVLTLEETKREDGSSYFLKRIKYVPLECSKDFLQSYD